MSQTTETPQKTLATATDENALPPARFVLIGTFIKPESLKALVRVKNSRILSVTLGDKISGARVVAIEEGVLHLEQQGRKSCLKIAGG